jgi:hypothetical protein
MHIKLQHYVVVYPKHGRTVGLQAILLQTCSFHVIDLLYFKDIVCDENIEKGVPTLLTTNKYFRLYLFGGTKCGKGLPFYITNTE